MQDQIKITCPNCGYINELHIYNSQNCNNPNCQYILKLFSKEGKADALNFYVITPSKFIKYISDTEDGYPFVAYSDFVKPLWIENILDLISPKVLQTIQAGLSERLQKPMSIYIQAKEGQDYQEDDKIIEKFRKDEKFYFRVNPIITKAHYSKYCVKVRSKKEGENLCTKNDIDIAARLIEESNTEPQIYHCWAGFIDIAVPIVINNIVVAIFETGQIIIKDDSFKSLRSRYVDKVGQLVSVSKFNLHRQFGTGYQLNNQNDLNHVITEIVNEVKLINDIVENKYWAERRVRELEFFAEIFSSFAVIKNNGILWPVLSMIFRRINDFAHFQISFLLLNSLKEETCFRPALSTQGTPLDNSAIFLSSMQLSEIFQKEKLLIIKADEEVTSLEIYEKILNYINVPLIDILTLYPFRLDNKQKGIILFVNRTKSSPNKNYNKTITKQRIDYIDKICHEIKVELSNFLNLSELKRSNTRLEKAEKIREHETRAPLATISANASFILKNLYEATARSKERRLNEIMSDVQNCAFLLKEVKIPSKEDFNANLAYIYPKQIVNSILDFLERQIERRSKFNIIFKKDSVENEFEITNFMKVECIGDSCKTTVHELLLKRAFYNLAINAVKYGRPNGKLSIKLYENSNKIVIEFSDNGIGIEPEDIDKIFNEEFRGSNVKNKYSGEGFGLSIAKNIIEAHDGTIELVSSRNPTLFQILLPIRITKKSSEYFDQNLLRADPFTKIS
jgi:signal transduction histidine kinase